MVPNDAHQVCRYLLSATRLETRVNVPPLVACSACKCQDGKPWYFVRNKKTGKLLWQGEACCAYEAKAHTIETLEKVIRV